MVLFRALSDARFTGAAALRFMPQPLRFALCITPLLFPPRLISTDIMSRPMMKQAKRHSPFVARLARQRSWLCKLDVMRLAWGSPADATAQRGVKLEVR